MKTSASSSPTNFLAGKWHEEYGAMAAPEKERAAFEAKASADVQEAIQLFKSGGVASFATFTDTSAH